MDTLELRITTPAQQEPIKWNYEELKAAVLEKTSTQSSIVVTEDTIPEAKAVRADFNRLRKALNDERIRREKEYMVPFNEFKAQVKDLCTILDEGSAKIGEQLDVFEEKRRAEKLEEIETLRLEITPFDAQWPALDQIMDEKWLNKSTTMSKIQQEMTEKFGRIDADLKTIASLPEYSFEATDCYKRTLDLNAAIAEGQRLADIQRRKEEQAKADEAKAQFEKELEEEMGAFDDLPFDLDEPLPEKEKATTVRFETTITPTQARQLVEFCNRAGIKLTQLTYTEI